VIPSDAVPLLNADRLDPRLFDVTALLDFGYDDRRTDLPLIVTGAPAAAGLRVTGDLPPMRATTLRQDRRSAATSWRALTTGANGKVWLDGNLKPTLAARRRRSSTSPSVRAHRPAVPPTASSTTCRRASPNCSTPNPARGGTLRCSKLFHR
jgi:hypothetical protein